MDNGIVPGWHKSKRSAGGNCVEIKRDGDRALMRDTKDRSGPVLDFDDDAFGAFLDDVKEGRFDLPEHGSD